ncbi:MAG: S1 RNA-binding domain-containing protein, partial [Phycisphaerae bacterium]|nr:S1 RNA-binding domain-containing protein [Phycisphaerae bacterium]
MNSETLRILDSIARDRNIDRELLLHDLEQAMISAARKHFNSLDTEEFGCEMDRLTGGITLWRELPEGGREEIPLSKLGRIPAQTAKQVMIQKFREDERNSLLEEFGCEMDRLSGRITLWREVPDVGREEIPLAKLGRIPAQTAKQVMIQKFREDERNSLLEEFGKRQGELVTGVAQRYEGGALIVQIDRAEGFMPRSEQIPGEQFQAGDRVRCLILDVRDAASQVKIVLSRSHP